MVQYLQFRILEFPFIFQDSKQKSSCEARPTEAVPDGPACQAKASFGNCWIHMGRSLAARIWRRIWSKMLGKTWFSSHRNLVVLPMKIMKHRENRWKVGGFGHETCETCWIYPSHMMTRYEKWEGLFTMFTMESLLGHILWDFIQTCWGSNMAGFNKGNFHRENDPQRSNLGIFTVFLDKPKW